MDWLLVGTSDIAQKRVAPALAALGTGRLVGVCGSNTRRTEQLAAKHGAEKAYTDLDKALADTQAGAVYVATPVYRHRPEALKALDAGKHVLIEKPLGLSEADCQPLVEKAESADLRAGCAYYRRCFPRYTHVKQMLKESRFGQIVLVRMTYFAWFSPDADDPKRWRVCRERSGGGPLADLGSHMFDLLIGLFGLPRSVFADVKTLVQSYEVEDASAVVMELSGGAQVVATFHWNSKTWAHEFEVVGTEAKVKWLPADTGKVLTTIGRDTEARNMPNAENVHTPLVEDFARAVRENRDPIVPLAEAAKTNRLLDAIYRSAEIGQRVLL